MTHLAATNTLMLHGHASLQKLVLQVCIKAIFRHYYSAFQILLRHCEGVIQLDVIGNADLLLHAQNFCVPGLSWLTLLKKND